MGMREGQSATFFLPAFADRIYREDITDAQ